MKTRKILSMLLAVALLLGLTGPVAADEGDTVIPKEETAVPAEETAVPTAPEEVPEAPAEPPAAPAEEPESPAEEPQEEIPAGQEADEPAPDAEEPAPEKAEEEEADPADGTPETFDEAPQEDAEDEADSPFLTDGVTLARYNGEERTVAIPAGIEIIGAGAFRGNRTIEEVTVPASVKEIGRAAFENCEKLRRVTLAAGSALEIIGDAAFRGCESLTTRAFADGVKNVSETAFDAVTEPEIPAGPAAADETAAPAEPEQTAPAEETVPDTDGAEETAEPDDTVENAVAKATATPSVNPAYSGEMLRIVGKVTNLDGEITYQWQRSADGSSWSKTTLGGNTTDTLAFSVSEARLAYAYRLSATNGTKTVYSNAVTVSLVGKATVKATAGQTVAFKNDPLTYTAQVSGTVGALTYQWQRSLDGETWSSTTLTGCKTDTLTFAATEARLSYMYRLAVTDANRVWHSNAVRVTYREKPDVRIYTNTILAFKGDQITMFVETSGTEGELSYRWQKSEDGVTWTNTSLTGYNTDTLTFAATKARLANRYRIAVTDANRTWHSNVIRITFREDPQIKAAADATVCFSGETVTIRATASGTTGDLAWQWQRSEDGETWSSTTLTGCKTDTLSFGATEARLSYRYRVAVTDAYRTWYSNAVKMTYRDKPVVKATAESTVVFKGDTVTVKGTATGTSGTLAWQWQRSLDGETWSSTTLTGCKTNTLTFGATEARLAYRYRVAVTDSYRTWYSPAVQFTYKDKPVISAAALESVAFSGDTVTIKATASGTTGTLTWQWQKSEDGQTWSSTTLTGCKTNTLTFSVTEARLAFRYRVAVKDNYRTWYSAAVKVTYKAKPTVKITPDSKVGFSGETITVTSALSGMTGTVTYQWQQNSGSSGSSSSSASSGTGTGGAWVASTLEGNKTGTLLIPATQTNLNYRYRLAVTDKYRTWYSNEISMTYKQAPTLQIYVSGSTAYQGDTVTYRVTASGTSGTVTYQWQRSTDGTTWSKTQLSGYNTTTLSFSATEARLSYMYRCAVTDANRTWYSPAAYISFAKPAVVTATSNVTKAYAGDTIMLTATATGTIGTVTYQWQKSTNNGSTWTNATFSGSTSSVMTFTATMENLSWVYRCVVTDRMKAWPSNTVSVAYNQKLYISSILANRDGSVVIKWPEIPGATYTLYYLKGSTGTPTTVYKSGITGTSITVTGLTFKTTYRFCLTATVGGVTSEKSAAVNVKVRGRIYRALLIGQVHFARETANRNWGDVNLMYNVITSRYTPIGTRYQTPVKKSDRTPSQVLSDISSAFSGADEDDVSLFFIATHGDSTSNGRYAGALECVDGNKKSYMLYLDELANALKAVPGEIIAVIESCGSGAAVYQEGVAQNGTEEEGDTLSTGSIVSAFSGNNMISEETVTYYFDEEGNEITLQDRTGEFRVAGKFYVLCASRYHENSYGYEGSNPRNVFTDFLCKGIGTSGSMPADTNYDYYVTLYEAFAYIKRCEDTDQHVQAYPSGSSYQLFKR